MNHHQNPEPGRKTANLILAILVLPILIWAVLHSPTWALAVVPLTLILASMLVEYPDLPLSQMPKILLMLTLDWLGLLAFLLLIMFLVS